VNATAAGPGGRGRPLEADPKTGLEDGHHRTPLSVDAQGAHRHCSPPSSRGSTASTASFPPSRRWAGRHAGYGVSATDFETVGAALLDTLEIGLKPDFTLETRDAWATAYGLLASVMIGAGESAGERSEESAA